MVICMKKVCPVLENVICLLCLNTCSCNGKYKIRTSNIGLYNGTSNSQTREKLAVAVFLIHI
jgi:hypothetical protein